MMKQFTDVLAQLLETMPLQLDLSKVNQLDNVNTQSDYEKLNDLTNQEKLKLLMSFGVWNAKSSCQELDRNKKTTEIEVEDFSTLKETCKEVAFYLLEKMITQNHHFTNINEDNNESTEESMRLKIK